MNPETVMVPRSRSAESQGCCVWKAEMWWNLCFVRNAPPGSTHIFENSGSSSSLWWPQAAIWLPWVLWNALPLQRAEEPSHTNRGWEMHREMPEECIRNARHLQHVTVRHHPRKSWKDPASRKSAGPTGVGVWECFYGNANTHSQEQPHHRDEIGCCQD